MNAKDQAQGRKRHNAEETAAIQEITISFLTCQTALVPS
jgi:hypothetical protein